MVMLSRAQVDDLLAEAARRSRPHRMLRDAIVEARRGRDPKRTVNVTQRPKGRFGRDPDLVTCEWDAWARRGWSPTQPADGRRGSGRS